MGRTIASVIVNLSLILTRTPLNMVDCFKLKRKEKKISKIPVFLTCPGGGLKLREPGIKSWFKRSSKQLQTSSAPGETKFAESIMLCHYKYSQTHA